MVVVSFTSRSPYTRAKSLDKRREVWVLMAPQKLLDLTEMSVERYTKARFSPNKIMVIKSRKGDIQNELRILTRIKLQSEIKTNSHLGNVRTHRYINRISTIRRC
jgi:hypothetical protein